MGTNAEWTELQTQPGQGWETSTPKPRTIPLKQCLHDFIIPGDPSSLEAKIHPSITKSTLSVFASHLPGTLTSSCEKPGALARHLQPG